MPHFFINSKQVENNQITIEKGERIPPCPRCSNQSFEKVTSDNQSKFEQLDRDYKTNN